MNKNYKNPNKVLDDVIEKSILKEEITTLKKLLVESNKELWELKEIEKEHQRINGELREEIKDYQKELEKADSITQSCIFNGKKESEISYRKALNELEKTNKENQELKDRIYKAIADIEQLGASDWRCFGRKILLETLKGDKETPDLFKEVKTITETPPVPKNMDTSRLQEFIDELKGDEISE